MKETSDSLTDTIKEFKYYLIDGDLTTDGVQWSADVLTVDADTAYKYESGAISIGTSRNLKMLKLNLAHRQKAGSATADVKYLWSISPNNTDWTTLFTEVTVANINTSYIDYVYTGYVDIATAVITEPTIYLKLEIKSNETTPGVSTAAVKNTSYVEMTYY